MMTKFQDRLYSGYWHQDHSIPVDQEDGKLCRKFKICSEGVWGILKVRVE